MFKKFLDKLREYQNPEDLEDSPPLPPSEKPSDADISVDLEESRPAPPPESESTDSHRRKKSDSQKLRDDPTSGGGSRQIEVDENAYAQRAAHVEQVEAMFSEYGPKVSSHILMQSLMSGGVRRVTEKLGLRSRGRDGADLAQIADWIDENGAEAFCQIVGVRTRSRTDVKLPKGEMPHIVDAEVKVVENLPQPTVRSLEDNQSRRTGGTPQVSRRGASDSQVRKSTTHTRKNTFKPINLKDKEESSGELRPVENTQDPKRPSPEPPQVQPDSETPTSKGFMFAPKSKKHRPKK